MHLLDVPGNKNVRIDERLEGRQLVAVERKRGAYFDEAVHDREQARGLSMKGEKVASARRRLSSFIRPDIVRAPMGIALSERRH